MLNSYAVSTTTMATPTSQKQQTLNLRHMRVGPRILTSLQHPKYESSLQSLCLGPTFSSTVTLAVILQSLPNSLQSLDLDVSRFSERRTSCAGYSAPELDWELELKNLWEGLPSKLDKLCLRFAKNDKEAMLALTKTLRYCRLSALDLRNNDIDDANAVAMASALKKCPTIRHLVLSFNRINNQGAMALGEALNFTSLCSLDLSHNSDIDDEAVEVFCRALETNTKLQEINLYGCRITRTGVESLIRCLNTYNLTLQQIHLTSKRPMRHDRERPAANNNSSDEDQSAQEERKALIHQLEYWLSLNRAGRELVERGNPTKVPVALWPHVFARKPKSNTVKTFRGPHELFFLLKENPGLFDSSLRCDDLMGR